MGWNGKFRELLLRFSWKMTYLNSVDVKLFSLGIISYSLFHMIILGRWNAVLRVFSDEIIRLFIFRFKNRPIQNSSRQVWMDLDQVVGLSNLEHWNWVFHQFYEIELWNKGLWNWGHFGSFKNYISHIITVNGILIKVPPTSRARSTLFLRNKNLVTLTGLGHVRMRKTLSF